MADHLDLEPAARRLADLAAATPDSRLDGPTPCTGMDVAGLLDHVMMLAQAFRQAADKTGSPDDGPPPEASGADLPPDWRIELPRRLDALAEAWRSPSAWEGETAAGGLVLSGQEAGAIALNELVLHGWDLARATDRPYRCEEWEAQVSHDFAASIPDVPEAREGLFGPVVPVPDDAPLFDRALGLSGRDPHWSPEPRP
ncbi:TIGR03086 family metal-binding protein [Nocardiopsis halophila]|uniref:TIGR03086 family metal-binding protein n=1 Tax=Nocardiopsis halophila TaxID=141692 RepID=UPI00034D10F0|nr:TIGR03086 family metal-binding protein [Nocardiopsis halophila]